MNKNHEELLKLRCRYGNCVLEESEYPVLKENFQEEFCFLGIDINRDDPTVYPSKVCKKHQALLIQVRASMAENRDFKPLSHVYEFKPHHSLYDICEPVIKKAERKRKRSSVAGPGRGNTEDRGETKAPDTALVKILKHFKTLSGEEVSAFLETIVEEILLLKKSMKHI